MNDMKTQYKSSEYSRQLNKRVHYVTPYGITSNKAKQGAKECARRVSQGMAGLNCHG